MIKYPNIGFENARTYLDEVLAPAYRQFTERETRANTLRVAEAGWAIHERLWHDLGRVPPLNEFRARLFEDCPELRLMRDIAEIGKHTGLSRDDVIVDRITGAENPGGISETSGFGMMLGGGKPTCTLTIDTIDGQHFPVPKTLKTVVQFWVRTLASDSL